VAGSTSAKYALGWRRWAAFRGQADLYLRESSPGECRRIILAFFAYLIYEHKATSNTVKGAWLGLAHFMRQDLEGERDTLADARLARDYADAMKTADAVNPAARQAPALPVYRGMAERSRAQGHRGTDVQRMVDLAYRLGAQAGSRIGELAREKITAHALRSDGVVFFDKRGTPHPAGGVVTTLPRAEQAVAVQITWPTTKVGPRVAYVTRETGEESQLLEDLHGWSTRALMVAESIFFRAEGPGGIVHLHKRMIADHIKSLATQCSLQTTAFTTRSLRVGLATGIRASQGTKASADAAGGWSPKAGTSLRYARATPRTSPGKGVTWSDLVIMQSAGGPGDPRERARTVSRGSTSR
jgi:hypothetical protein